MIDRQDKWLLTYGGLLIVLLTLAAVLMFAAAVQGAQLIPAPDCTEDRSCWLEIDETPFPKPRPVVRPAPIDWGRIESLPAIPVTDLEDAPALPPKRPNVEDRYCRYRGEVIRVHRVNGVVMGITTWETDPPRWFPAPARSCVGGIVR